MTDDPLLAPAPPPELESLTRTGCRLFPRSRFAHLDRPIPWLWNGYIFRTGLTLLTGQWKVGKTTLLAALLSRLGNGGTLAGRRVEPGRVVVITEEGASLWLKRMAKHDIGDWVSFAFHPFPLKPLPRQWGFLLEDLADLHRRKPIHLIVIDPLVAVLSGREESSAAAMTDILRPLREFAATGPGVLILHHPRKGVSVGGQWARGTGALPAFVDVLLEMHWPGRAEEDTRRRRLSAWSRFDDPPRRVLVELSPDGTDYAVVPDEPNVPPPPDDEVQRVLMELLRTTPGQTVRELAIQMPAGMAAKCVSALNRRLLALVEFGRVERRGSGHRFTPYRYWVVEGAEGPIPIQGP